MELETIFLSLGLVVGLAAVLLFIAKLGTRGQSYEEVVAANRKLAAERGLVDEAARQKRLQQQQTKKNKKAGKKVKEKQAKEQAATSNSEVESESQPENGDEPQSHPHHVEFIEPAPVAAPEPQHKPLKAKKRGKEVKVKPILINKDDPSCVSDLSAPPSPSACQPANHFEEIHPKDEFELLHSGDRQEKQEAIKETKPVKLAKVTKAVVKPSPPIEAPAPVKPEPAVETASETVPKEQRKNKTKPLPAPAVVETAEVVQKPSEMVSSVSSSSSISQPADLTIDKILKQSYTLEMGTVTNNTVPNGQTSATQNAASLKGKKKKNDASQLSQLTRGADGVNVNILVRQLAEMPLSRSEIQILTDCLLNKQNGPVPEHSEWSEGPKDPMQKLKKQLAEKEKALADEQEAAQAVRAKLVELRASINTDRSKWTQLLANTEKGMATHAAEILMLQGRIQRSADESTGQRQQIHQLQAKLASEGEFAAQKSQMEMHIQSLSEAQVAMANTVEALKVQLNDTENAKLSLANDLHLANNQINAVNHQTSDLARKLEDAQQMYTKLDEHRLNTERSEQFVKQELQQATERLKGLDVAESEVGRLNAHTHQQSLVHEKRFEELDRQNQQLTLELNALKAERDGLNSSVKNLKEELASQPTPNGTTTPTDKDDSVNTEKAVAAACKELEEKHSQQIDTLQKQLDQHRDKNNDLIRRNWKVMEELTAEKKTQQNNKSQKSLDDDTLREAITKACLEEQRQTKEVLERLFPQVSVHGKTHKEWVDSFTEKAAGVLSATAKAAAPQPQQANKHNDQELDKIKNENSQLQTMVDKYKKIIFDTEGVLSRLQSDVTLEEQRWAKQLSEKDIELDNLKKHYNAQIQEKMDTLQSIEATLEQKHNLRATAETTRSKPLMGGMGDMEKLLEENARLVEVIDRLQKTSRQSLNGPSQLIPNTTFERIPSKKRRSIAGWFRRKITFRRKKSKEARAVDQERQPLGEARAENGLQDRHRRPDDLSRRSSASSFHCASSKTL